jgi:hypothetical protein
MMLFLGIKGNMHEQKKHVASLKKIALFTA